MTEEDFQLHTLTNPFCYDPSCPCHEDRENIAEVAADYSDGLFTAQEATDFVAGKMM